MQKVGGLFPNALYINVSGFSLPPIITDRHHITEKLLSMAKNSKQSIHLLLPVQCNTTQIFPHFMRGWASVYSAG
jgi:hypothetical protein